MFDISKLNKSSFRGIPFYTQEGELSGGNRLSTHSFINGGTKVESNGVKNNTFKIVAYIGGDDYLAQKETLKQAFEDITAGTLIDKFNGTHQVYVDTWSIKEGITKFGKAEIEIVFKKAENNIVEDFDLVYNVDIKVEITAKFEKEFDNKIGEDLRNSIADDIKDMWEKVLGIVKFLEDERDRAQNIKSTVGKTIAQIKTTILSIESLAIEINDIWASFDEVLDTTLIGRDEQKSFTNILREIIEQDSEKIFDNEAQRSAARQTSTYLYAVVAGLTQTAIKNLENIEFTTGNDFGSVKDDVLKIYELLEKDIDIDQEKPIEELIADQELLDGYRLSKRTFIQFYTQKFSNLQSLKDRVIQSTTDILSLTMEKYGDISRANEVVVNNDILDPIFISGDIKLLDR